MPAVLHECGFCRTQQAPNAEGTCTACGGPLRPLAGQSSSGERRRGASSRLLADALEDVGRPQNEIRAPAEAIHQTLEFNAVMPIPGAPPPAPAAPPAPPPGSGSGTRRQSGRLTGTFTVPNVVAPPAEPPPAVPPAVPPAAPPRVGSQSSAQIVHTQRFEAVIPVPPPDAPAPVPAPPPAPAPRPFERPLMSSYEEEPEERMARGDVVLTALENDSRSSPALPAHEQVSRDESNEESREDSRYESKDESREESKDESKDDSKPDHRRLEPESRDASGGDFSALTTQREEGPPTAVKVLLVVAGLCIVGVIVVGLVFLKGGGSTSAALKQAQGTLAGDPARTLQLLDQAGLSQAARADVQLVRARAALALGQDSRAKEAVSLGVRDTQASRDDVGGLAAVRGALLAKEQNWREAASAFEEASRALTNDAAVFRQLARAKLALKDYAAAETAAARARDLSPNDVGSRIVLARCALVHGELAKGMKELEGLLTDDESYFLTRAELKLRRDDAEGAKTDLDRVKTTSHELHLLRAAVLLASNDVQGSLAAASAADADNVPGDLEPRRAMARALVAEGRGGEALRILDETAAKADRESADLAGIANERALACLAVDDIQRAENVLQQAGAVPANHVAERARRSLAEAAVSLAAGKADAALAAAKRGAQELDDPVAIATGAPVFVLDRVPIVSSRLAARAWALAARSADRAGLGKEVPEYLKKAMEGAPNATDILSIAAVDKLIRGDLTGAKIALEDATKGAPRDASIRAKIGSLNLALQNWDEAKRNLEEAIKLGAQDPLVFLDLSRAHLHLKKPDLAATVIEEAREKGLEPGAYAYARARIAKEKNALGEQQEWLERTLRIRSFDVAVLEELADVKAANGRAADAAVAYEALLRLDPNRERWLYAWVRQSMAANLEPKTTRARLELAIKRLPKDPSLVALRGHLLLETDADGAIRELEAALSANDKLPEAALDLAVARIRAGAPGAAEALARAYKLCENKDDVSLQIEKEAQRFKDKGQTQWERAILAAESLIANDPRRRSAHVLICQLRYSMKDWRQLWEAARRADQLFPGDKEIREFMDKARKELDLLDRGK